MPGSVPSARRLAEVATGEQPPAGGRATVIEGVLFDIDDTLVDLETAMGKTLHHIAGDAFGHLSDDDWAEYKRLFASDPQGHYEGFLAGELTFTEQRLRRLLARPEHAGRTVSRTHRTQTGTRRAAMLPE